MSTTFGRYPASGPTDHEAKVASIAQCYVQCRQAGLDHDAAEAEVNRLRTVSDQPTDAQQHTEGIDKGRKMWSATGHLD